MVESQGDDADKGGMAPKQIITQVREGIREVFERAQGVAPVVDRSEPKVVVVAHLRHGRCMLSFDTSGKSLHKRGYREQGHPAPLKETLSAAILIMAGYDGSQAFLDPMWQRHDCHRSCNDSGPQGAADPSQEGPISFRVAQRFRS
jgi:putative N6-adenine-specific DNA methylase